MIVHIGYQEKVEDRTEWMPADELKFPIKNLAELKAQLQYN